MAKQFGLTAAQQLVQDVHRWAIKLKVNPASVRVCDLDGKWGQCDSKGNITFSHDVTSLSGISRDVVIVHELMHLRYRDHGRLFQACMSAYVPGWKEAEKALEDHFADVSKMIGEGGAA